MGAQFLKAAYKTLMQETPWKKQGASIVFIPKMTSDQGGVTKWGISAKANPGVDVANLTLEDAFKIYRKYWDSMHGNLFASQDSANPFFDHSFNAGLGSAISTAREALIALGAKSKLILSASLPELISVINHYPSNFPKMYGQKRLDYYRRITEKNPKRNAGSLHSWETRTRNFFRVDVATVAGVAAVLFLAGSIALYSKRTAHNGT